MSGLHPTDRDAMIRTVLTEASSNDPMGWAAVASTIRNRLAAGRFGQSPTEIVRAPGAFEVWSNGRAQSVSPKDPNYEAAGRIVDAVAGGLPDPTGGATHFYSLSGQSAMGRQPPKWGKDPLAAIGGNTFYAPEGRVTFQGAAPAAIEAATSGTAVASKNDLPSDDEFLKSWGVDSKKASPGSSSPAEAPAGAAASSPASAGPSQSDDEFLQSWGVNTAATRKNAPAATKSGSGAIPPGDAAAAIGSGIGDLPVIGPYVKEGMIKGAAALGRAVNPMVGLPSPSEDQIRQWDAQLKQNNPAAYVGGQVLGGTAALLPLGSTAVGAAALGARAPGFVTQASGLLPATARLGSQAVAGGGTNALIGAADAYVRGDNPLTGAGVGGAIGAAAPAIGVPMMALGRGAMAAVEPFTNAGQTNIADRIIGKFAEGGPLAIKSGNPLVDGSVPTLAEATQNPGLATLQRGAEAVRPNPFEARKAERNAARDELVSGLKGDQASLEGLISDRQTQTDPLREAAFADAGKADPANVVKKIDEILAGPEGQRDVVVKTLGSIKNKITKGGGEAADPMAAITGSQPTSPKVETDPSQLYGIRKAIGDILDRTGPKTENDARLASSQLMAVKNELDKSIEGAAPGFKDYLSKFSDLSKPIDTQSYLQGLKLTNAEGKITLGGVDRAITSIEKARAGGGANAAKSIPDGVMEQLHNLRQDLRSQTFGANAGRGAGSNTFQNFATNNMASQLGMPLTAVGALTQNPMLAFGAHLLNQAYKSKNEAIMDQLVNRLLTPQLPASSAFATSLPGGQTANIAPLLLPALVPPNRNRLTSP
jgi:hypothetical protein